MRVHVKAPFLISWHSCHWLHAYKLSRVGLDMGKKYVWTYVRSQILSH